MSTRSKRLNKQRNKKPITLERNSEKITPKRRRDPQPLKLKD